jgi:hypothetical protein
VRKDLHDAWAAALREGGEAAPRAVLRGVWPQLPPLAAAGERAALERAARCEVGGGAGGAAGGGDAPGGSRPGGCDTQ